MTTITDNNKYDLGIRKTFNSVDGDTLLDMDLPATKFVIKDLLPQGLAIIGGSPKVGKSWLMLDWCVRIAKGEKIWNFPVTQGTTLYVSLEDTASRLQERLLSVTDEAPNVFFTTFSFKIGEGLEEQIKNFVAEHPDTVLIVIDTFQMIRNTGSEVSYSSDYNEVEVIKKLAEELKITILLVHHLRKQGDSDPFNMKDRKLSIRISEKDLQTLHHKADKANLSITDYVTKCCLGKQIFVIDGLDEVIRQQKAIGRNLNQLTTLCNMGKVDCVNLQPLTDEYSKLNQTLTELLDRKRWAA